MRGYLRLFSHTVRHTFDLAGRAPRAEFLTYIVLSQIVVVLIASPAAWFVPGAVADWTRLAVQLLAVMPAIALVVRRLHDFGMSGRWSLIMLAVAVRTFALDGLDLIGGWQTRSAVESPLAYVDWLLFLPFVALYAMLLLVPGSRSANRFGAGRARADTPADMETAGTEYPEPAA